MTTDNPMPEHIAAQEQYSTPEVTVISQPPVRSRKKFLTMFAVVAATVAVGGGLMVLNTTSIQAGGAESPEAAVRQLLESASKEDALGAMDVLLPAERDTFKQPIVHMFEELKRLDVLDTKASLGGFKGMDLELSVESTRVEQVASDISNVYFKGKTHTATDWSKLPLSEKFFKNTDTSREELGKDAQTRDEDLDGRLTTVEDNGRWYVSIGYTIAEGLRESAGTEMPAQGVDAPGFGTPQEAVEGLIGAFEDGNTTALVASLNPGEAGALQRYAPLLIENGDDTFDNFDLKVSNVKYDIADGDGHQRATFSSIVINADGQDGSARRTFGFENGCYFYNSTYDEPLFGSSEAKTCVEGTDYPIPSIALVEHKGHWYVSPIMSAFDIMFDKLATVTPEQTAEFLKDPFGMKAIEDAQGDETSIDALASALEQVDGAEETTSEEETISEEEATSVLDDAIYNCYNDDRDAQQACFDDLVASGQVNDMTLIPLENRFPECDLYSVYDITLETVGDAEYTNAEYTKHVAATKTCLEAHIANGEMQELELPFELTDDAIRCADGKNPGLDAAAYNEWVDCASGEVSETTTP